MFMCKHWARSVAKMREIVKGSETHRSGEWSFFVTDKHTLISRYSISINQQFCSQSLAIIAIHQGTLSWLRLPSSHSQVRKFHLHCLCGASEKLFLQNIHLYDNLIIFIWMVKITAQLVHCSIPFLPGSIEISKKIVWLDDSREGDKIHCFCYWYPLRS